MASIAAKMDSEDLGTGETKFSNSKIPTDSTEELPISDLSDEDENIVSEGENDGYEGDIDNRTLNIPSDSVSYSISETAKESKNSKKNFSNKKTRFISETKRAARIKQYATKTLSNPDNLQINPDMPHQVNDVVETQKLSCDELHFQKTGKTVILDKLELSSTTSSDEGEKQLLQNKTKNNGQSAMNASKPDSPSTNKTIDSQRKPKNGRKRKNENFEKEKGSEEKKKKKQKGSHLRKNIKDIIETNALQVESKEAKAEEQERLKRLQEAQAAQKNLLLNQWSKQRLLKGQLDPKAKSKTQDDEIINISSSSGEESKPNKYQVMASTVLNRMLPNQETNLIHKPNHYSMNKEPAKKNEISLDHSSSDDCKIVEYEDVLEESDDEDPDNSGMHVDDRLNVPQLHGDNKIEKVLVNIGHPSNEPDIFLPPQIQAVVKPHQVGGIRFLYDNLIESLHRFKSSQGLGCILAHAMGLGKTLQVVSFCDLFLRYTNSKRILCIVPINTIQNWQAEFNKWLPAKVNISNDSTSNYISRQFQIYLLNDTLKNLEQRAKVVLKWKETGGVLLMGYELFRLLATKKQRKKRKKKADPHICIDLEEEDVEKAHLEEIQKVLVKPGPDLVVCDEGHRIKNAHASTSQALKSIATKRRLVLTGYPLQNNLMEYWCMVDFVRPNYLGNKVEFANMFERPIQNGLCVDSTSKDARVMMHRSHVLYHELKGFVQRRSHNVLKSTLPPKHEYVILVRMSKIQKTLYQTFMNQMVLNAFVTANPLKAFAVCCKIWNHPDVLFNYIQKREASNQLDLDIEIDEPGTPSTSIHDNANSSTSNLKASEQTTDTKCISYDHLGQSSQNTMTHKGMINHGPGFNPMGFSTHFSGKKSSTVEDVDYDWVEGLFEGYKCGALENSAKLTIFLHLLDETILTGERMLLFSQSLFTLDLIEDFLQKRQIPNLCTNWVPGIHYYRLDGSTPAMERERLINSFNAADNAINSSSVNRIIEEKTKPLLFLISTRAGSLGVNLTGANRVVIFDASWNPCHDSQAVCRIYRYGQVRPSYVYRLVTDGSLERKIYDRQINKQGMSNRIVDEMNPDAYLHSKDINTLLCLEENEPRGNICKESGKSKDVDPDAFIDIDPVLAKVLRETKEETTAQPFAHESLLIDRKEKKLSKAEKRMAERSYKIERGARISYKRTSYANFYPQAATSQSALSNHISTEKFNGMPSSFGHISSMNLNLKRNSYASYYNKPEQSSSDDRSSSFMNATSSRLSQLYEGAQDIDGSPTPVHPVLPAVNPSSNRLHDESTKQLQCPIQQKLPPNHYKSSNLSDQMQSKSMSEQCKSL